MEAAALERLIDTYCSAWNEPDAARRKALLEAVWNEGAAYTDPRAHAVGVDALAAHIGRILERRPGAKVIRTSAVDEHHGLVRFAWRLVEADGNQLPEGIDFAEIAPGGRIARIVGFFGPLVARA
jgi:hypothetical protein